ncbi:MAG: TatD family hydrolase [Gammaproteobacteria bacterium]|jgi:TatD DNase family protein
MLVDSHCHLDMLRLEQESLPDVLREAEELGIEHLLCVSVSLERFPGMMDLIEPYGQISASVGVHPDGQNVEEPDEEHLVSLASHPRVVAIGETGLDYYRAEGDTGWQRERFRCHIRAARAADKPLIVHTREARDDTLRILEEEDAAEVGGVLHCFTEDWDMARAAMDLNFRISFSGIVTFRNAAQIKDVARRMPSDRILVETDSPYLAPVPMRGKSNRPGYVRYVAEHIAELRGASLAQVAETTTANFYALFRDARSAP